MGVAIDPTASWAEHCLSRTAVKLDITLLVGRYDASEPSLVETSDDCRRAIAAETKSSRNSAFTITQHIRYSEHFPCVSTVGRLFLWHHS